MITLEKPSDTGGSASGELRGPAAAQSPALLFQNVSKHYGKQRVLSGLNLEVGRGEFFGLVGVNGAGKTTMMKCLLDFCRTDSGHIEIFGVDHGLTAARRPVAFLPEHLTPPYYLNGKDFLQYMLQLQAMPYHQDEAENMLNALDLDLAALARPVCAYSKGMTQKLGLAGCFLRRKELYVLDEPMSGLDPKARSLVKMHLKRLKAAGSTLFFSSHSLSDIQEICSRMAILHKGEIRFAGTPAECCEKYGGDLEQAYLACIR